MLSRGDRRQGRGASPDVLRVMGMTVVVVAASVLDRVVLVPAVLVPLVVVGVFPHLLLAFAILDPVLGIGAWVLLSRSADTG